MNALKEAWLEKEKILDRRTALICVILANINRRKNQRAFKLEDFMPKEVKETPKTQTLDDRLAMLRMFNLMNGGKEVING